MSSGGNAQLNLTRTAAITKTAHVFGALKEAVILADTDRRITWVNQAFTDLMGYTLEELLGRKTQVLYDRATDYNAQGRTRYNATCAPVKANYMVNYRHKTGRLIRSETIGWAVRDDAGEVIGFAALIRDMDELLDLHDVMSQLYDISSSQTMSGHEKIQAIMRTGCEYFRLPTAIVCQAQGAHCTVLHAQSTISDISPGMQFDLGDMLCGATLAEDGPLCVADAHHGRFKEYPCVTDLNQRSYIGLPLTVDGDRFGTLSFSSPIARSSFSAEEVDLIKLFAAWIAQEIAIMRAHEELKRAASTDWLTRVATRRQFHPDLEAAFIDYVTSGQVSSLVMVDIDHFKQINDQYGHGTGDVALREVAEILREVMPYGATLYRIGGEEFACLMPGFGTEEALTSAEHMRAAAAELRVPQPKGELQLTISLGVATLHADLNEPDAWLSQADAALYASKSAGRNQVSCARPAKVVDMFELGCTHPTPVLKAVGARSG